MLGPPPGGAGDVRVLLDGRPIQTVARAPTSTTAWCASTASACTTWSPRPTGEHHALTLRVAPGVQAYAFTFG